MTDDEIKERQKAIWPEVIGAVITERDGKINLCPINFQAVSTVYEKPITVCVGLDNKSYSLETASLNGEFTYSYPSSRQLTDVLHCGTVTGRDGDKLSETSLMFEPAKNVKPPLLNDAVANFECKLAHSYNAGDFTILIGAVVGYHSVQDYTLDKIYSLGGMNYGVIKEIDVLQEGR